MNKIYKTEWNLFKVINKILGTRRKGIWNFFNINPFQGNDFFFTPFHYIIEV